MIALAAYKKKITGLVGPQTDINVLCPADASHLGLGTLTVNGTTCTSSILVNGNPAVVTASGTINQPNPIDVTGVEFSVQQNLDFLPAPWSNFGGAVNFSIADIDGRTVAGTPATLPGVSKRAGNFITLGQGARSDRHLRFGEHHAALLRGAGRLQSHGRAAGGIPERRADPAPCGFRRTHVPAQPASGFLVPGARPGAKVFRRGRARDPQWRGQKYWPAR
jgi:hypothetical protein